MKEIETLKYFLSLPLWTSQGIFEKFRTINGSIFRENSPLGRERFLFVEGGKKNKVVLIAHADTYFDERHSRSRIKYPGIKHSVIEEDGFFRSQDIDGNRMGLGADDRAGCAILWLLKDSGHSILITDGEEEGQIGSNWLKNSNRDIFDLINQHQFMIQFDRQGKNDFKCYGVGSDAFREFIEIETGFQEPNQRAGTDICALSKTICGVNFSVGYYNEHNSNEEICIPEWERTFRITQKLLEKELQRFER